MKKFFDLTTDKAWKLLYNLIEEAGFEPNHYRIFQTGGLGYIVTCLTSDLYMSNKPINQKIRKNIIKLNKFGRLFVINDKIKTSKSNWDKEQFENDKNKIIETLNKKEEDYENE